MITLSEDRRSDTAGQRTRVAHVALSLAVGGAEKLLLEFSRHANAARFDLSFIALNSDGVIGDELRSMGARVDVLDAGDGLRPSLVFRLARYFRRHGIDIVHTHLDRPHIYGTIAARTAGVRQVVHTRHGQADNLSERQHRLVRWVSHWTDSFVCVSHDAEQRSAQLHGVPRSRLRTIHNGIDLNRFTAPGRNIDGPWVIAARLTPEKNVEMLLHAAAELVAADPKLRVEVAGDGPCRGALERRSRELGLEGHVRFVGQVADVPRFLGQAAGFILPSLTEGIALALLEAQAQRLPVIATRVGGNQEVIKDGHNGLLVDSGSVSQLAAAWGRLRSDPELANQLGAAGRAQIERQYDARQMVARYEQLYAAPRKADVEAATICRTPDHEVPSCEL